MFTSSAEYQKLLFLVEVEVVNGNEWKWFARRCRGVCKQLHLRSASVEARLCLDEDVDLGVELVAVDPLS